jgi:hypothetical protein
MNIPQKDFWIIRLIGIGTITIAWFLLSIYLSFMSISIADTTDVKTIVPLWLKIACSVALFPLDLIEFLMASIGLSLSAIPDKYERLGADLSFFLIFINSLLWGLLWFFLFRFAARFVVKFSRNATRKN